MRDRGADADGRDFGLRAGLRRRRPGASAARQLSQAAGIAPALWLTLALADDILEEWQKQALAEKLYQKTRTYLTPKRRSRSRPRKVRQPVSGWPQLLKNEYCKEADTFNFVQP